MSILETMVTLVTKKGVLVHKAQLSPTAYHVRIQSDSFKDTKYTPGDFLRIFVGIGNKDLPFKEKLRSYSVWHLDRTRGELDLAITTLGKGPGAQWAIESKAGDTIHFVWHKGRFNVHDLAQDYIFIGDLSALSTFYAFNRTLPGKTIYPIIYSHHQQDFFPDIDHTAPFKFHSLPHDPSPQILAQLTSLKPNLNPSAIAYIAGDSRVCITATQFLRTQWQWGPKQIKTKPYWNPLKTGLD